MLILFYSPFQYDANNWSPDSGTPRYTRKGGILVPMRVFYDFGTLKAIEAMHRHHVFREHCKKNIDLSIDDYRFSKNVQRLNAAMRGEALADMNGCYIYMADGFQSHKLKTKSIICSVSHGSCLPWSLSKCISLRPLLMFALFMCWCCSVWCCCGYFGVADVVGDFVDDHTCIMGNLDSCR